MLSLALASILSRWERRAKRQLRTILGRQARRYDQVSMKPAR